METFSISDRLLSYFKQNGNIDVQLQREMIIGIIKIYGDFIYDFIVPNSWYLDDIKRIDNRKIYFHWHPKTNQASCPTCETVSTNRCKTYKTRYIQDLPIASMTVYHAIKSNRYNCDNSECSAITFIEQFNDFAVENARISNRLKDFIIRMALESTGNGSSKVLREMGIIVSRNTIIRELQKKGAIVVAANLNRDDVSVLSVDDINLQKGNSSTACSVFIDAQTHRVLAIIQGSSSERAANVIKKFPSAKFLSRDRGCAYSDAGEACGKEQVADRFHLMQNIHKVIKDVLSLEMGQDLFVREGKGWVSLVDSSSENELLDKPEGEDEKGLIVIKTGTTLVNDDIENRIKLADLKTREANKYRKTLQVVELTESGLYTSEIAKRLSMKTTEIRNYRKNAPEIIENVEQKIDEYYKMHEKGQWEYHQDTIAKKARPSSESIVEPYKETVLKLFMEGKNHRNIHPVIVKEGFNGSANAVYQYMIKYAHENNMTYGRNSRVIPPEERNNNVLTERPSRISIDRISKKTIYDGILHLAASRRDKEKQSLAMVETIPIVNENINLDNDTESTSWVNKTNYDEEIAKIIFDTTEKNKTVKKN
jgi:transposase